MNQIKNIYQCSTRQGFEQKFSNIQSDMVSACLEYIEHRANKLYIYASYKQKTITCNFFYEINGKIYKKHKLPNGYDVSIGRQMACLNILTEDVKKLISICKEYDAEMPAEIKITFDVNSNKLNATYQYDEVLFYAQKEANGIVEEWFQKFYSGLI